MTYMLNSIDEAIDEKYLVTKPIKNQAKVGSMVHIMNAKQNKNGILIDYRITTTGQNYMVKFQNINEFYKWARPDSFIARHYESFSKKEIKDYIAVNNRTFVNFCLPILLVALVVIWICALVFVKGTIGFILGGVLSVVALFGIVFFNNKSRSSMKQKMYHKVSKKWGIEFK